MKIVRQLTLSAMFVLATLSAWAAPVESIESARASAALQKVDAFLGEQAVVDQLTALGLSAADARARIAQLDDRQLEQLAAEVDLLQAGGKIVSGYVNKLGPLGCVLCQIRATLRHIFQVLFCWDDIR